MHWRIDQNSIRIPTAQAVVGLSASMGGAVVGDPENASGRSVGLLIHDQVDQLVEMDNTGTGAAEPKELGMVNIPRCQIGQSTFSVVLMFNTSCTACDRGDSGNQASSGLDAGFFIRANHEVVLAQRLGIPGSVVQIQSQIQLR